MHPIFFIIPLCITSVVCSFPTTKQLFVEKVTNNVQIGALAGNRNLEFGVKNILDEALLEKDYELTPTAALKLRVEIIYLDVLTTKKNISVFHQNAESVVIRLSGIVIDSTGKIIRKAVVEESSAEISMSAVLIDAGGKFNQTSLSNALKKASVLLINKLTE